MLAVAMQNEEESCACGQARRRRNAARADLYLRVQEARAEREHQVSGTLIFRAPPSPAHSASHDAAIQ